ncbi:PH domain-containing protein [Herbiconiux sp. CPCC 205716]|uniref:PH domain-containing protein n=1 Tax=Herbiconiux gentiana TaxID=2970912 RepID=A0ABT2GJ45_9MICO|nr:PH domain-containing protein [Herbiconiux gentiana]MCS5716227.1 PH domain-containing protein [Herbiconiux gentiana]
MSRPDPTTLEPPRELVLARVRPHARRLTVPVLLLFATTTAYGWFGGRFAEEWQNQAALGGAVLLVVVGTLLPFLVWLGHRYTITTRRIIARRGLVNRHRQDLWLSRVTAVHLRRNPAQAAFASGNVLVESGSELTLELHDVPSAKLVAALLDELTEHTPPVSRLPAFPGSHAGAFGGGPPLG